MFRMRFRGAMSMAPAIVASFLVISSADATGFITLDNAIQPPHPVSGRTRLPISLPGTGSTAIEYLGLHLQSEHIKVDVSEQVAKTYVSQTFANDTDRDMAGTFLFPLPEDTTFSSFSLHIDDKPVEGKILEAKEARQEYEAIVRKLVDPGLLEYADYKTVRARIFPIPAHGTKKVELEYTQVLKADDGMLQYRFPLKAPGETAKVDDLNVEIKMTSKQGIKTLWSPSHEIKIDRSTDSKATVEYNAMKTVPDKDFVLYYSISSKEIAANLLTHKLASEDGYFLLTITPQLNAPHIIGKDLVLVVDTSGSMMGKKLEQTKEAIKFVINALHADDRFALLQFNTDIDVFASKLQSVTEANKKAALAWVDKLEASSGTNIFDALKTGATMLNESNTRPAYIILLTDGEPNAGNTNVDDIVAAVSSKRDVRVFDFGVGYDVNTKLLNKIAQAHHGVAQYVAPSENIEIAVASLYKKVQSPVLNDVKLTFTGVTAKDFYPKEVGDLFAGSQIILIGKYKEGSTGSVSLSGSVNGATKSYSFPLNFAKEETANSYLPRLWAMRRIGHLTEMAQDNHNPQAVVDEIVGLSKKYGIITAYTSFLATSPQETLPRGASGQLNGWGMPFGRKPVLHGHGDENFYQSSVDYGGGPRTTSPATGVSLPSGGAGLAPPRLYEDEDVTAKNANARTPATLPATSGYSSTINTSRRTPVLMQDTGEAAFSNARNTKTLEQSTVASTVMGASVKTAEDKTFYLVNGVWTDSTYSANSSPKPIEIAFGSDAYFKLIHDNPGINKFLALGEQVLVLYKGKCYKITAENS
ncbi:MAG: VWA domain-containing protein [Candidatus Obscuribacterales bacterium]|nr:VWA domain-containing protein [Candidatus Obscuribacterales bacterium]